MCITEDKLVESYETGLFNRILFEVEYNRRKKNDDDLGVRIQTSHCSDPTAAKAICKCQYMNVQKVENKNVHFIRHSSFEFGSKSTFLSLSLYDGPLIDTTVE